MKVLLTNDDGVVSPGIQIMARILADRGKLSGVLAPDRERSGTGHAITMTHPVKIWLLEQGMFPSSAPAYACDGTPTDCVTIALEDVFTDADFVMSGINQGPNLGDDITYSGTACAALEGLVLERNAMAISLCSKPGDLACHNTTAAAVGIRLLEYIETEPLPEGIMLNVNVPNLPLRNLRGVAVTKRGHRRYTEKLTKIKDPKGRDCYWIGGSIEDGFEEGTDVWAVHSGYVSITPVHLDMTHYGTVESMISKNAEKILSASVLGH